MPQSKPALPGPSSPQPQPSSPCLQFKSTVVRSASADSLQPNGVPEKLNIETKGQASPVSISPSDGDPLAPSAPKPARRGRKPGWGAKGKEKAGSKEEADQVVAQLIDHLPEATQDALQTFVSLDENWYQNKSLGLSKLVEDSMACECSWGPGDDPQLACSEHSGCINYLTQIECTAGECKCRAMCRNQRFQKRLYAPIEIVLTDKKGYGVRLKEELPTDAFVHEYIGEVVGHKAFQRRLKDYADEGLRHFYFMQLQSQEYIDATKKGGLARFFNHSCRPNCYIGKWVVGRQLRMGIFTKRQVKAGEELTFNYNVDRYGHQAQDCHCGESNCVGYLGGNKQTDVGALDDLYIDALGIMDEVETLSLKGSKTKKSRRMDYDYVPVMKPIPIKDVPKVASAIRQSISSRRILSKLLSRILITIDSAVQKQLMRLHGFSMMSMVLNEYLEDQEIVKTVLEILLKWPLLTKNKLISTNLEENVMRLSSSPSPVIQTLAARLVEMWVALKVSYKIPRERKLEGGDAESSKRKSDTILDQIFSKRLRENGGSGSVLASVKLVSDVVFVKPEAAKPINPQDIKPENLQLPLNWTYEKTKEGRPYYFHVSLRKTQWNIPTSADVERVEREVAELFARQKAPAFDVNDIVARAKADEESLRAQNEAKRKLMEEQQRDRERMQSHHKKNTKEKRHLHHHPQKFKDRSRSTNGAHSSSHELLHLKEIKDRKMLKLFSAVVVQTMSRYKSSFEHDQFKRRAKELTDILCSKEAKSNHYPDETYDHLTPQKETKIRAFTKDWTVKLLSRKKNNSSSNHPYQLHPSALAPGMASTDSSGSPSTSNHHRPCNSTEGRTEAENRHLQPQDSPFATAQNEGRGAGCKKEGTEHPTGPGGQHEAREEPQAKLKEGQEQAQEEGKRSNGLFRCSSLSSEELG